MQRFFFRLLLLTTSLSIFSATLAAIPWPVLAGDTHHQIGNTYGEYQSYESIGGINPFLHTGMDIMVPAGTPVYAVKSGYVKAVLTTGYEYHWRVAIGDSAGEAECDGWMYAHLDPNSITVYESEWVEQGRYLGNVIAWSVYDFNHLHFAKIRDAGYFWSGDWDFVGNPLDELEGIADSSAPVFEPALTSQLFAFCRNIVIDYFPEGAPISGDVDIICRVHDVINEPLWDVTPYKMEYRIAGDSSIPWITTACFTGYLDWQHNWWVLFKRDSVCYSYAEYESRAYYFTLTNTDGDSIIESTDNERCWKTADFRNGAYTVYARASDRAGNATVDSMTVEVANYFALTGTVTTSDGNSDLSGVVVTVLPSGDSAVGNAAGQFALAAVGGGSQLITIARQGYESLDTMIVMNQARTVTAVLDPIIFTRGDANFDGILNIGDAVYVVNYVFRGGPSPRPLMAGDINSDGAINIGDAVYLVNYLFRQGPPPPPA